MFSHGFDYRHPLRKRRAEMRGVHIPYRLSVIASRAKTALRRYALTLPGAWEDHPWGEDVAKVGKKVFVFFGRPLDVALMVGVKLPASLLYARSRQFTVPFGYGMDRHGWVAAHFKASTTCRSTS
jgi:predicted DNA-binding protein (MmcQ/YjbR family)